MRVIFFFNDTATTEIYTDCHTLSLHDALPISRRNLIRPTAIEAQLRTRYTIDTVKALRRRYPRHHFIWLMGADNLAQFGQWRDWRGIARLMPIAVITRPGYEEAARGSPAMGRSEASHGGKECIRRGIYRLWPVN